MFKLAYLFLLFDLYI